MTRKKSPFYPVSGARLTTKDKKEVRSAGLDQEIDLLRYYIRRISLKQDEACDLIEAASVLRTIALSLFTLTGLIRTHYTLKAAGEPAADQLENSLRDIAEELKTCQIEGTQDYDFSLLIPASSDPADSPVLPAFIPDDTDSS